MTTTATEDKTGKVDLAESAPSNGQVAPKRRGRPPGSKNKPKGGTTTSTRRRAAVPPKAATPTRTAPKVHAVLVSNDGIEVLLADGSTKTFTVSLTGATPLFDRRK